MLKSNYEGKKLEDLKYVFRNKHLYPSWFIDEVSLLVEVNISNENNSACHSDIICQNATFLFHSKYWLNW